jgi:hypothetical protein
VSSQFPRIYDAAACARVLLPPRTTTYRSRAEVPRAQLYLDVPGTPHRDHAPMPLELGARLIRGLERLGADEIAGPVEPVSVENGEEGIGHDGF